MDAQNNEGKGQADEAGKSPSASEASKPIIPTPNGDKLSTGEVARRIWAFLKVPANFLSILAIIATVIVPAVEKLLNADEVLRAKIDTLIDTTDKIIDVRDNIEQLPPSNSVDIKRALLDAKREDYLSHAFELAKSIQSHVDPPILLVLSSELISDERYDQARIFLEIVIARGSKEEKAKAHIQLAGCLTDQIGSGRGLKNEEQIQLNNEMNAALALFSETNIDAVKYHRASILSEWALMDDQLADTNGASRLRAEAETLLASASPRQSNNQSNALPAIPLDSRLLPRSSEYTVYKITSIDEPNRMEALTLFSSLGDLDTNDILNYLHWNPTPRGLANDGLH